VKIKKQNKGYVIVSKFNKKLSREYSNRNDAGNSIFMFKEQLRKLGRIKERDRDKRKQELREKKYD